MYVRSLFPLLTLAAISFQAAAQSYTDPFQNPPPPPPVQAPVRPATQAYYNAVSFAQNNPVQVGGAHLVMQSDGNFVMYYPGGSWSTLTAGQDCSQGCHADFQPDGNLVLYNGTSWFWASHTDGKGSNLLLSQNAPYVSIIGPQGSTVWAAVPSFNDLILPQNASVLVNGGALTMQGDGNLVLNNDLGAPVWDLGTAGQACGGSGCAAYIVDGQLDVYAGSNLIYQSPTGGLTLAVNAPYVSVGGTAIGHITAAGCISTQDQRNTVINTLSSLQTWSTKFTSPSPTENDLISCINNINTQVNTAASQQWTCTATGATIFLEEACGIQLRKDLTINTSPGVGGIQHTADGGRLVGPDGQPVPQIISDQLGVLTGTAGLANEYGASAGLIADSSYSVPGLDFSSGPIQYLSDGSVPVSIDVSTYGYVPGLVLTMPGLSTPVVLPDANISKAGGLGSIAQQMSPGALVVPLVSPMTGQTPKGW